MAKLSKNNIKRQPDIPYLFLRILVIDDIYDLLQEIVQMRKNIKGLSTTSDNHRGRLTNILEWRKAIVRAWVDTERLACPL